MCIKVCQNWIFVRPFWPSVRAQGGQCFEFFTHFVVDRIKSNCVLNVSSMKTYHTLSISDYLWPIVAVKNDKHDKVTQTNWILLAITSMENHIFRLVVARLLLQNYFGEHGQAQVTRWHFDFPLGPLSIPCALNIVSNMWYKHNLKYVSMLNE